MKKRRLRDFPVVMCEEIAPKQPGGVTTWPFWCPFCRCFHTHGCNSPLGRREHRVAHCHVKSSPFLAMGYILKPSRTAKTPGARASGRAHRDGC